jgi:beta-N-acetylhexosaminidase
MMHSGRGLAFALLFGAGVGLVATVLLLAGRSSEARSDQSAPVAIVALVPQGAQDGTRATATATPPAARTSTLNALPPLTPTLPATAAPDASPQPPTSDPSPTPADPIAERLARMTPTEKIGQMLMFGFFGRAVTPGLREMISAWHVGNIILLPENAGRPEQVRALTGAYQEIAVAANQGIGLLIAADQEGGSRVTLTQGFSAWPRNAAVGASGSPAEAARVAAGIAREMEAVGINMNLAPVLDVNDNPANPVIGWRSYGPDPTLVGDLGVAAITAHQREGVIPTAKHFPGHGNTDQDSHVTRPVVSRPRAELERIELAPFKRAVAAHVDAIMTAHVVYPALDPNRPATLSRPILTDLLRRQMGFDGVIITDDFTMEGVLRDYGAGRAAVLAVEAGADIVMVVATEARQREVYDALIGAYNDGRLTEARLDESVRRILALKNRYGLLQ